MFECPDLTFLIQGMVSHGRVELLSHELSHKYLQMKWNAYGKYIHLAQLVLYILYLAILTSFASNIVYTNELEHEAEHDVAMQMQSRTLSVGASTSKLLKFQVIDMVVQINRI